MQKLIGKRLEEELESGIQTIFYQINTSITTKGKKPSVTLYLNLDKEDEYIEENRKIAEEIQKQEPEECFISDKKMKKLKERKL